jgi:hypothetical protein
MIKTIYPLAVRKIESDGIIDKMINDAQDEWDECDLDVLLKEYQKRTHPMEMAEASIGYLTSCIGIARLICERKDM